MKLLFAMFVFALTTSLQLGCARAGDAARPAAMALCNTNAADCAPDASKDALQPIVPPVPSSPLRLDCQRLPTQLERDTCVNRKQSTG